MRQPGHRETATVKPTIQTVPMIMRMMPTLRRDSGAASTTPHQNACVAGASPQRGMFDLAATHRKAINKRTTPRPIRKKPVLLIRQGLTFEYSDGSGDSSSKIAVLNDDHAL